MSSAQVSGYPSLGTTIVVDVEVVEWVAVEEKNPCMNDINWHLLLSL